ncbi:MAG: 50S ribosomal protein L29 [Bacteroidota bacterium]
MKNPVIRELSKPELLERIEEEEKQLLKLKMNHAVSPLENPTKIKAARKLVARLKTNLKQREIEQVENQTKQ